MKDLSKKYEDQITVIIHRLIDALDKYQHAFAFQASRLLEKNLKYFDAENNKLVISPGKLKIFISELNKIAQGTYSIPFIKDTESCLKAAINTAHKKNDTIIITTLKFTAATVITERIFKLLGREPLKGTITLKTALHSDYLIDLFRKMISQKVDNLTLSERVWKISNTNVSIIEDMLKFGISKGKSANEISRDVKKFLNNPEMLFRRIRDNNGRLHLSKAAQNYHPGQGVYRSSYKNAKRMVVTEINKAYKMADIERYRNIDFIVGYEVNLSNSHDTDDMCDNLAGRYPKGFTFYGWHPTCRCFITPVMITDKEMETYRENIWNDKEYDTTESKNMVGDVPKGFTNWIDKNRDRVGNWEKQPEFIRLNFNEGNIKKGLKDF